MASRKTWTHRSFCRNSSFCQVHTFKVLTPNMYFNLTPIYVLFVKRSYQARFWLFSHDGKVRILNRDSRCASWITIRNTVFWTVCTPNHVEICDLRCVTRKHLWTVIWDAHLKSRNSTWFGVHTVQNTVFQIVIQDAHLESRFKIRTLPSCENSMSLQISYPTILFTMLMGFLNYGRFIIHVLLLGTSKAFTLSDSLPCNSLQ